MVNRIWPTAVAGEADSVSSVSASACHIGGPNSVNPGQICKSMVSHWLKYINSIIVVIHHLSTPLRRCFFSLLSYSATRLREYILCCMRRTAILKNNSTAEKRREEEAFALKSIAHYCFVEIKSNCDLGTPHKR